jgi:IMP dehydrogenase
MQEYLGYNDVCLVPKYNNVDSRTEPSLRAHLTRNVDIDIPILAAPMDTVINADLARELVRLGSMPLFHRFTDVETQKKWVDEFGQQCFLSCGLNNLDQTVELLSYCGVNGGGPARGVVVDIAHGHCSRMLEFIRNLKSKLPHTEVIAGSVATSRAVQDLYNAGADAIRCNIGNGAACTTRIKTGFGLPSFTCVQECARTASELRIPLIADGGIEYPKDMAIAIGAGASTVMMGKKFAATVESAGKLVVGADGVKYKHYRGQASEEFQLDFYGGLKAKTVAEGVDFNVRCSGTVEDLVGEYTGAFRSAMTYNASRNIHEFQRKAEFVKVGPSYMQESLPRC